jgi:3,4-dihydroxy 2-butanone 4-phosphate synthase / GTP cyclohydrolase II
VLARFHKPNIMNDIFQAPPAIGKALERFKAAGSGVIVYLRDGTAGVPATPLDPGSSDAMRNERWREVGVGAQILRDLGVRSIRNLSSSSRSFPGLSGFGIEITGTDTLE